MVEIGKPWNFLHAFLLRCQGCNDKDSNNKEKQNKSKFNGRKKRPEKICFFQKIMLPKKGNFG